MKLLFTLSQVSFCIEFEDLLELYEFILNFSKNNDENIYCDIIMFGLVI